MRKKLDETEKKSKLTCTINQKLLDEIKKNNHNVSKYIEWLIYLDLRKNNKIDEMPL
jgi:hypothetical protein